MSVVDHEFVPSAAANPRLQRCCGKCSRVPEVHPTPAEPTVEERLARRSPEFEREFMRGAAKIAGIDNGWTESVHDRMQRMEREKGTSAYLAWTVDRIATEDDEEGMDLGGWSVLGALLAYRDIPDAETRHYVQSEFQHIAALGAIVRMHVNNIRGALR